MNFCVRERWYFGAVNKKNHVDLMAQVLFFCGDVRNHQPKSLFTHVIQLLTFQQSNEPTKKREKKTSFLRMSSGECFTMIPQSM